LPGRNWTRKSNFDYTAHVATKARTPPRRLTARGAATRARIVAAAASLVYERGFAGTSLDDVMAATGTSKSQLYHYFAGKDALIREVIKAQLGRIFAAQQAAGLHEISSWDGLAQIGAEQRVLGGAQRRARSAAVCGPGSPAPPRGHRAPARSCGMRCASCP
jgi:AcrR family transcriptional regulator